MKKLLVTLLVLIVVTAIVDGLATAHFRRDILHTDQSIFFCQSERFASLPWWQRLLPPLALAEHDAAPTHPFAAYLFSFALQDFHRFYQRATLLNLAVGFALTLSLLFVTYTHGGLVGCIAAMSLFISNWHVTHICTQLSAEPLLLLFLVWFFHFSHGVLERPTEHSRGCWMLSGVTAGLCFLAKPSGIILLPILFLAVVLSRQRLFCRGALYAIVAFLLIVAPLMVANVHHGRFPLYNDNFNVIFALTYEGYDDSTHLPLISSKGWYDNLSALMSSESVHRYLGHLPIFCRCFVRSFVIYVIPDETAGAFCALLLAGFVVLYWRLGYENSHFVPLLVPFLILYMACIVPVTVDNDSPRFYLPAYIPLYLMVAGLSARFSRKRAFVAILIGCSVLCCSQRLRWAHRHWGNPLEAREASIDQFCRWLDEAEAPPHGCQIIVPVWDEWWATKIFDGEAKTRWQPRFHIVHNQADAIERLTSAPVDLLFLSTRGLQYCFPDGQGSFLFEDDPLPYRLVIEDVVLEQVGGRGLKRMAAYRLTATSAQTPYLPSPPPPGH